MTTIAIDYTAGDTLVMAFEVRHKSTGRPISLSGASARWSIAPIINARTLGTTALTLTSTDGEITFSGNTATVTLENGTFTDVGAYKHELEIVLSTGESLTVASGPFTSAQAINTD